MRLDTMIYNAYIVSVPALRIEVIYGTVIEDRKGRFIKGNYVCSSAIISKNSDAKIFTTRNSVYAAYGKVKKIIASIHEFKLIIKGMNPNDAALFLASVESTKNTRH
jgi:hypothetical protein